MLFILNLHLTKVFLYPIKQLQDLIEDLLNKDKTLFNEKYLKFI
jgi:hypothetical protein